MPVLWYNTTKVPRVSHRWDNPVPCRCFNTSHLRTLSKTCSCDAFQLVLKMLWTDLSFHIRIIQKKSLSKSIFYIIVPCSIINATQHTHTDMNPTHTRVHTCAHTHVSPTAIATNNSSSLQLAGWSLGRQHRWKLINTNRCSSRT